MLVDMVLSSIVTTNTHFSDLFDTVVDKYIEIINSGNFHREGGGTKKGNSILILQIILRMICPLTLSLFINESPFHGFSC